MFFCRPMSTDAKIVRFKPPRPKPEPLFTDAKRWELEGGFDGKVKRGEEVLPAHVPEPPWADD